MTGTFDGFKGLQILVRKWPLYLRTAMSWAIERRWMQRDAREEITFPTCGLAGHEAVCLLGSAGLGKTWELDLLARHEESLGRNVIRVALGSAAASGLALRDAIERKVRNVHGNSSVFLDGLDEAMVPVRQAAAVIEDWIVDGFPTGARLRIACRSQVWPGVVADAVGRNFKESVTVELQPFTDDDIRQILSDEGIECDAAITAIKQTGVFVLAQQPLTLKLLIHELRSPGGLPTSRFELFDRSVTRLCQESDERIERGTTPDVAPHELLKAAERLAVFSVTTGRELVDLRDHRDSTTPSLTVLELTQLPSSAGHAFDHQFLRTIANTGLFDGAGQRRYRFLHRQFAEYLAGRRIAKLPFFQARALLARDSGWSTGVAGPLRETAAVAASIKSDSSDIAEWIASHDPEIIGLSDVADEQLRKKALAGLLELFRRHKLTDSHLSRNMVSLNGLRYSSADGDLRAVLKERGDGLQDLHACAIALAEAWRLNSLADDIADMLLDESLPFDTRDYAGYALYDLDAPEAKRKVLPLVRKATDHKSQELLGLALRCNWPENITTESLLAVLDAPNEASFHGAYQGFLYELELSWFDASKDRLAGLRWAIRMLDEADRFSRTHAVAGRILSSAVEQFSDPQVVEFFVQYVLKAHELHIKLFEARHGDEGKDAVRHELASKFASDSVLRRVLIDELVNSGEKRIAIESAFRSVPGLMHVDDFRWLLERALGPSNDVDKRCLYAGLAFWLPWRDKSEMIDTWVEHCESEPILSVFRIPRVVALGSQRAADMRRNYERMREAENSRSDTAKKIEPPPVDRIQILLERSKDDPRWFSQLVRTLTLTETSTHYKFERFVLTTPGWSGATDEVQREILTAAKRFLDSCPDIAARSRGAPLNTIFHDGAMAAVFLLLTEDSSWLDGRPSAWWTTWSWYILRELHFDLMDEENLPKEKLLKLVYFHSADATRQHLVRIARRKGDSHLLDRILSRVVDIPDNQLDDAFCECIKKRDITGDSLSSVASFVLARAPAKSMPICLGRLALTSHSKSTVPAVRVATALLTQQPTAAWPHLDAFFRKRPDLGAHAIARFAHLRRRIVRGDSDTALSIAGMGPTGVGRLLSLMFILFPPEKDPKHDGAFYVSELDSAVMLRKDLLNWLSAFKEEAGVSALRKIEAEHGPKYPWLRRSRAEAERQFLLSQWQPPPLQTIAEILANGEKRLLRSGQDVIDGIISALNRYNDEINTGLPARLDELWNDAYQGVEDARRIPSPKSEEHVSDKICEVVRREFTQFAITANREVQVRRRHTPSAEGGAPGSEVDVYVDVPAVGTSDGQMLIVILEVKRSCNIEAKTGLKHQLVDRYMVEEGTEFGVFVVAYFDAPGGLRCSHKPKWESIDMARSDLDAQGRAVVAESIGTYKVESFVIDARRR